MAVILERIRERMAYFWRMVDAQVSPGHYILGDDLSVLDLYVALVSISCWGRRRVRFYQEAPKMAQAVRRVGRAPRLQRLWAERFPLEGL